MSTALKPYPEYKETDLPWLSTVPAHWDVKRAKQVFRCIDIRSKTGGEELLTVSSSDGVRKRRSKAVTMFMAESYVGHKLCWPGDLVVNSLWAWATGLGFSRYHGIISTAYSVYRPNSEYAENWEYFHHLFRSRAYDWEFTVRSKGIWISRLQMTDESFMQMPVLLPPAEEQDAIIRFIRHLDHRVNHLIKSKRRLIELLNEQRQAIIHRTITRGLDPDAPMKPSGIEWLGNIPAHWQTDELRRLTRFISGGTPSKAEPSFWVGNIPWVSPKDMKKPIIDDAIDHISEAGRASSRLALLPTETMLIVVRGMILVRTVPVALTSNPVTINQDMKGLLIKREQVLPEFLYLAMKAAEFEILSMVDISGHGTRKLLTEHLSRLKLPIPSLPEQAQLVLRVNLETTAINYSIDKTQSEINLIREYRTRLIADVVTGQLDVRHIVLPQIEDDLDEQSHDLDLNTDTDAEFEADGATNE